MEKNIYSLDYTESPSLSTMKVVAAILLLSQNSATWHHYLQCWEMLSFLKSRAQFDFTIDVLPSFALLLTTAQKPGH